MVKNLSVAFHMFIWERFEYKWTEFNDTLESKVTVGYTVGWGVMTNYVVQLALNCC